jgi:hypothetical protein
LTKWDKKKLKIFCTTKRNGHQIKRQPTKWKKIFAAIHLIRIYRELKIPNSPKINGPMKKWENKVNRVFFKRRSSNSQKSHEEMLNIPGHRRNANQIMLRLHLSPVRMANTKNNNNNKCW